MLEFKWFFILDTYIVRVRWIQEYRAHFSVKFVTYYSYNNFEIKTGLESSNQASLFEAIFTCFYFEVKSHSYPDISHLDIQGAVNMLKT